MRRLVVVVDLDDVPPARSCRRMSSGRSSMT
jgi:hypothetical protein